jgi:hypothetical protein
VTNRALEHLRAFPKLRNLSLRQTAVDDAGLQVLSRFRGSSARVLFSQR